MPQRLARALQKFIKLPDDPWKSFRLFRQKERMVIFACLMIALFHAWTWIILYTLSLSKGKRHACLSSSSGIQEGNLWIRPPKSTRFGERYRDSDMIILVFTFEPLQWLKRCKKYSNKTSVFLIEKIESDFTFHL